MLALLALAAPGLAHAATEGGEASAGRPPSCSSEGRPRPRALLERFTSADCEGCWRDAATPAAPAGTLALDWVVPTARGDDAPLSAVALPEARERLQALGLPVPSADAAENRRAGLRPRDGAHPLALRAALGLPINDYIGASIRASGEAATGQAWLLLVERLPAGTEGSPVERRLVRAVFRPDWQAPPRRPGRREELRPLRLPEGAQAGRLELVAWVEDAQGQPRAIVLADCGPPGRPR